MAGVVCLQGGGEFAAGCRDMDADLVRRAGGGPVVVTALASSPGDEYESAAANGVRHFRDLGATEVIAAPDVREAPAAAVAAIRRARLLVLPGGSPSRLRAALTQTAVGAVISELAAGGAVVMGSSAGAMLVCGWTVLPDERGPHGPRVTTGLGLVPDALVLPHYSEGSAGEWLAAVRAGDGSAGVDVLALPERSGVLVEGSVITAVGTHPATLLLAAGGRQLPVGQSWDRAA